MGVGKSMRTFFEGMENQFLGGYSSKIVSTPMGPFRWDDNRELWENVNNGMVLNNISFQDMMFMGYDSTSGDNGSPASGTTCYDAGFATSQNIRIGFTGQNVWYYAPVTKTTTTNTCPFVLYVDAEDITGTLSINDFTFKYKNSPSTDSDLSPNLAPYEDLIFGTEGTNVTITPGTTFGYSSGDVTSKFIVAMLYNNYSEDPTETVIGNLSFKLKFYNKTTNAVIHTAGITFNNLDTSAVLTPSSFGNMTGITTGSADQIVWAGTTGPRPTMLDGTAVVITDVYPNILLGLTSSMSYGDIGTPNIQTFYYSIDGAEANTYTSPFAVSNDNEVRIGAKFPQQTALEISAQGSIRVFNQSAGSTLTGITWSYSIEGAF